jgi:hypothetical protein
LLVVPSLVAPSHVAPSLVKRAGVDKTCERGANETGVDNTCGENADDTSEGDVENTRFYFYAFGK